MHPTFLSVGCACMHQYIRCVHVVVGSLVRVLALQLDVMPVLKSAVAVEDSTKGGWYIRGMKCARESQPSRQGKQIRSEAYGFAMWATEAGALRDMHKFRVAVEVRAMRACVVCGCLLSCFTFVVLQCVRVLFCVILHFKTL